MNAEIKKKWLEKLRDPKTKQARYGLGFKSGGRCCLGVLCDLGVEAGIVQITGELNGELCYGTNLATNYLPPEVQQWADIDSDPRVVSQKEKQRLSWFNDNKLKFTEIADLIEEQL